MSGVFASRLCDNRPVEPPIGQTTDSQIPCVIDHLPFRNGEYRYIVHVPPAPDDFRPVEGNPDDALKELLAGACATHGKTIDAAFWDGFGGFVPPPSEAEVRHRRPDDHLSYVYHHRVRPAELLKCSHWPTYIWSEDGSLAVYSSLDIPVTVVSSKSSDDAAWSLFGDRAVRFDPSIKEPDLLLLIPRNANP